ncbi:MAG: HD-GYP domain-containing protein [Planctomycetota bacterium]
MERFKQFLIRHFEVVLVGVVVVSVIAIHFVIAAKAAFLSFYYLPVLLAGCFLGKRHAVATAVFSILVVVILAVLRPAPFYGQDGSTFSAIMNLTGWGAFLLLTSAVVGILFEAKEAQVRHLRNAYVGIVEILAKYLESTDRYTKGHSVRVAHLSMDMAMAMELSRREVENIRTAALLHDIGKVEVSGDLIRKAAELTSAEKKVVGSHAEKGGEILESVGNVLKDAVPLVLAHHKFYKGGPESQSHGTRQEEMPLGARIIAVADAYDAIVTDRPYRKGRPPWQAIKEIEQATPEQFDPKAVEALARVMANLVEEQDTEAAAEAGAFSVSDHEDPLGDDQQHP